MFEELLTTIQHRPYVVTFFITFFILSTLHLGIFRTLFWLLWGYTIAFISEYASIHIGFPYGLYHYIPSSFFGELALAGIPIWDSVSYVFIAYASFATAWFLTESHFGRFKMDPHVSPSRPLKISIIASLLMTLADIIIDPVANLGEHWFLGKIYYYEQEGFYFGVPLSNFFGWFLVATIIIAGFQLLEKFILTPLKLPVWGAKRFPFQGLLGPLFYFGILGFMLTITMMIKAYTLLLFSGTIAMILILCISRRLKP